MVYSIRLKPDYILTTRRMSIGVVRQIEKLFTESVSSILAEQDTHSQEKKIICPRCGKEKKLVNIEFNVIGDNPDNGVCVASNCFVRQCGCNIDIPKDVEKMLCNLTEPANFYI